MSPAPAHTTLHWPVVPEPLRVRALARIGPLATSGYAVATKHHLTCLFCSTGSGRMENKAMYLHTFNERENGSVFEEPFEGRNLSKLNLCEDGESGLLVRLARGGGAAGAGGFELGELLGGVCGDLGCSGSSSAIWPHAGKGAWAELGAQLQLWVPGNQSRGAIPAPGRGGCPGSGCLGGSSTMMNVSQTERGNFSSPAGTASLGETLRESHCKEASVPPLPFWSDGGMAEPGHHGPLEVPRVSFGSTTNQGCAPGKVAFLAKG